MFVEEWKPILDFPEYMVSRFGKVRHETASRDLSVYTSNTGTPYISVWKEGRSRNRSLALIVARAFLDEPPYDHYDTPINLNGDRFDNRVENLMWRPNWYARAYHKQFTFKSTGFVSPIVLLDTGETFNNTWEAAITLGLLEVDVLDAVLNYTRTRLTCQTFRVAQ
jgi:hypothetical protein